jgi:hypothetical protein
MIEIRVTTIVLSGLKIKREALAFNHRQNAMVSWRKMLARKIREDSPSLNIPSSRVSENSRLSKGDQKHRGEYTSLRGELHLGVLARIVLCCVYRVDLDNVAILAVAKTENRK